MSNDEILDQIWKQVVMNTDSIWIYNLDLFGFDIPEDVLGGEIPERVNAFETVVAIV